MKPDHAQAENPQRREEALSLVGQRQGHAPLSRHEPSGLAHEPKRARRLRGTTATAENFAKIIRKALAGEQQLNSPIIAGQQNSSP